MSDPSPQWSFLEAEIERLEPFAFVRTVPPGHPLQAVEAFRSESGALEVQVPGRPRVVPALPEPVRDALRERGFTCEEPADSVHPWIHGVDDPAEATALLRRVLVEVFGREPEGTIDVLHGDRREEHETRQKLGQVRERVEKIVTELHGKTPEKDSDGDLVLPVNDVHLTIAPRALPGGPVIVRVFAVTNVGVNVTPDLGLLLARLNFGLAFGRFAMDAEHRSIWFDETLLGEYFGDEELRFAIRVVASTADEWDDRLKQMFGGATWQEVVTHRTEHEAPPTKPGLGGYL